VIYGSKDKLLSTPFVNEQGCNQLIFSGNKMIVIIVVLFSGGCKTFVSCCTLQLNMVRKFSGGQLLGCPSLVAGLSTIMEPNQIIASFLPSEVKERRDFRVCTNDKPIYSGIKFCILADSTSYFC